MTRHRRHHRSSSHVRLVSVTLALLVAAVGLSACADDTGRRRDGAAPPVPPGRKPNIIFVLTDDLAWNLVAHMPQVRRMQQDGLTFDQFYVADSLCCTSRASIFTGQYPHNTKVRTNFPPDGGYGVFRERGGEQASFAPALQRAGYRTAMMGKYMNGYAPADTLGGSGPYVPPGWNEWYVTGNGYPGYGYTMNENGRLVPYGSRPQDYMTDVLANKGAEFVQRAGGAKQPFYLQISTFAPHGPFVPAPRHANAFGGLKAPRPPSFNEADNSDKPSWLKSRPKLRPAGIRAIDRGFRDRVRMVQAVDEMIGRIRQSLTALGLDRDTYLVFGSDNGFHMGEYRLAGGKMTAFDSDLRVPYIVVGPGVRRGHKVGALVQNTDLAPTFLQLAGLPVPPTTDGRSLAPFLRGTDPAGWRDAVLVEHVKPPPSAEDPDRQDSGPGAPPTYNAVRTRDALYVEYANGEREYYDLTRDPHQLDNQGARMAEDRRLQLSGLLRSLTQCSGATCGPASQIR